MLEIVCRLLGLVVLLLPMVTAGLLIWGHAWPSARSAERLLAAVITVPFVLIVEIAALSTLPVPRPLQYLWTVQLVLSASSLVLTIRFRRDLYRLYTSAKVALGEGWKTASTSQKVAIVLGATVQLTALVYGTWQTPWTVDELSYHIPQALQPFHDGRLGTVRSNVVWADSYPRGAALLYYWTLQLGHTDAGIHPVNGTMGVVFMLATYVGGYALGLTRASRLLAAGVLPTAPIFWLLSTTGYIDVSVAAAIATSIAFAACPPDTRWRWPRTIALAVASALALWMKVLAVGVIAYLWGFVVVAAALQMYHDAQRRGARRDWHTVGELLAGAVGLAVIGIIPYSVTWQAYGSPVYPLQLTILSHVIFDGPMIESEVGMLNELPRAERHIAYWTNWSTPLGTDAYGSFGPLFTIAMLPSVVVCLLWAIRARQRPWILVTTSFLLVFLLPKHYLPRYSVWALMGGALSIARIYEWGGRWRQSILGTAVTFIAVVNLTAVAKDVKQTMVWKLGFGKNLLTSARDRVIADVVEHDAVPNGVNAETRRLLYANVADGQLVVSAVQGIFGYLYDHRYRYRVEHRPAAPWPYYFDLCKAPDHGAAHVRPWHESLLRDRAAVVVLYSGTSEDQRLRADTGHFALLHEQPARLDGCAIRVYKRRS